MHNLASALKREVSRIARKEARSEISVTKRQATQHRSDIAELKRLVTTLQKEVNFLRSQEKKRATRKPSAAEADGHRFSPTWLKAHRKKVGMPAADYAKLVGVHPITVYSWEQGKSKPRAAQLATLVELRKLGKREAHKRLEMVA